MESSGRNGDDAERPAGEGTDHARLPLERSPEGRFVVRSSSHPPNEQTSGIDSSGVHSRPHSAPAEAKGSPQRDSDRGRPGRSTPAERPRKRKELQQGGAYLANVRARCDTPRLLPGARISDRPPSNATPVDTSGVSQPSSPVSALVAEPTSANGRYEERAGVDEVTRRVRRPSSVEPPPSHDAGPQAALAWRSVVTAGVVIALLLIGVWLLG